MSTTSLLKVRLSKEQAILLRTRAQANGCATVSDYVRKRCLADDNLSLHAKLDIILKELKPQYEVATR